MITAQAACLTDLHGNTVPLEGVTAHGRLAGLVFELTVEQRYRNTSADTIETVYTFPLPLQAVLLSFELEIASSRHVGQVVEKQAAARRYEQAIDNGDSAALLVDQGNGLYTVNLANLPPGESAVLRYRYAQCLSAHDGYLRLQVPTVIAPRYGNPADAGLRGETVPVFDVLVDYPFTLTLALDGLRDAGGVRSPSHQVAVRTVESGLAVTLAGRNALDRDVVIELAQASLPTAATLAQDGDGLVVAATPALPVDRAERRPLRLKLLLDCSGSMQGARIASARRALEAILRQLDAADHLALARFGSHYVPVSEGLEPMDARTRDAVALLVRGVDADLGGTEMEAALQELLKVPVPRGERADVVLVTDGEVDAVDALADLGARAGHRLFVVAIGAAPNEALARRVAEASGGACEFVGDDEDAEAAILRMVLRLRSVPRTIERITWPEGAQPTWVLPAPPAVFPGETFALFAGFATAPRGELRVTVKTTDGRLEDVIIPIGTDIDHSDLLPRVAVARRLPALAAKDALALALRHQLVSARTSCVVVAERATGEKIIGVPKTVVVPQMLELANLCSDSFRMAAPQSPMIVAEASFAAASSGPIASRRSFDDAIAYQRAMPRRGRIDLDRTPRATRLDLSALRSRLLAHLSAGGAVPTTFPELASILGAEGALLVAELAATIRRGGFIEQDAIAALVGTLVGQANAGSEAAVAALQALPVLTSRAHRPLRRAVSAMLS